MSFDAGEIEATLKLNRDQFQRDLDAAKRSGQDFSKEKYTASLDVSNDEAKAKATETGAVYDALRENLQRGMNLEVTADEADATAAETGSIYDILRANLERTIRIKADYDGAAADAGLAITAAEEDKVNRKLSIGGGGGFSGLLRQIGGLGDAFGGLGQDMSGVQASGMGMVGAIVSALPLLVAAIVPLVGLTGALGAGFVGAGVAFGGFAALAMPLLSKMVKDHQALTLAQQQYTNATTGAQRTSALQAEAKATANLTGSEKGLFGMLQQIISLYKRLQSEFARPITNALKPWFAAARDILNLLPALIRPVLPVITQLGYLFDALINSPSFKAFFRQLGQFGAQSLYMFGIAIFNLMKGFGGLVQAFEPLARVLLPGLVKLTDQFAQWGTTVGKTKGFHQFVQYVIANLPTLGSLFVSLLTLTLKLVIAFMPLGSILLRVAAALAGFLAAMPPDKLAVLVGGISLLIALMTGGLPFIILAVTALTSAVILSLPKIVRAFDVTRHAIANVFDGMRHDIANIWDAIWNNTVGRMIRGQQDVFQLGNKMRNQIADTYDSIRHYIANAWNVIWNNTIGRLQNGVGDAEGLFDSLRHGIASRFDAIRHNIASAWDTIWNNTVGRIQQGVQDVGSAVNGIKRAMANPINWVIRYVLNDGLIKAFDWVTGKIGGPHINPIPAIKLAAGGRITAGTSPTADDVLIRASHDETVVSAAHSKMLAPVFAAAGVPGYQHGGVVGNRAPFPGRNPGLDQPTAGSEPFGGGVLHKLRDIVGIVTGGLTGNATALINDFEDLIGGKSGTGGAVGDMAKLLVQTPITLIKDVVKWLMTQGGGLSGSGADIVRYAMQFVGRIPYVWGGTAVPGGADCSGFVQTIYKHFGFSPPRTSEAQGDWVKKGPPQLGGLAFYNSPAGGPPPGHVAIVGSGGRVISQGGGMGPQVIPLHALPLMFTGVPPGGFHAGPHSGRYTLPGLESLWTQAGGPPGSAHVAGAIALAESGGVPRIIQQGQPYGTTGWGLWQITPGNSVPAYGVNQAMLNPLNNAKAAVFKYHMAQGFSPWTTWEDGAYRQFMDRGGPLGPGTHMISNTTGRAEEVLTPEERQAFIALAKSGMSPLIGTYSTNFYGVGDTSDALRELTFTLQRVKLQGVPSGHG